jgi:calcineurin-like phosphoesterase family protein
MYQRIKLESLDKTFVVSDCHFNHDRDFVWGKRGYNSCHEHNESIIAELNKRVSKNDVVFHLGDFMFGDNKGTLTREIIARLNFKQLYLLPGNHVSGVHKVYEECLAYEFGGERPKYDVFPLVTAVPVGRELIFLPNLVEIVVEKQLFVLCHYPIISHNSQSHGTYMVCGHSHSNCALTNKNTGKGRRVDVGIESFGGPVNLNLIINVLKDRELDCVDHH